MFCEKCEAKAKEKIVLCSDCGAEILPKKQNAHKSLSKKAKAVIACVCVVALLISGTVGGLYFFRNHTDNLTGLDSNYIFFAEGFTDVLVTDEKSALEAIKSVAGVIGIENVDDELKISSTNTVGSDIYYRFQQYYNDIPVYGNSIVISADGDGNVTALTSNITSGDKSENSNKKASVDEINKSLKKHFDFNEIEVESSKLDALYYLNDNKLELVYVIDCPESGRTVIVNAINAKVIDSFPIYVNESVDCKYNNLDIKGAKINSGQYLVGDEERKIYIFTGDYRNCLYHAPNNDICVIKDVASPLLSNDNVFGNTNDIYSNEDYGKGIDLLTNLQIISDYYKSLDSNLDTSSIGVINDNFTSENGYGALGGYNKWSNVTSYNLNFNYDETNTLFLGTNLSTNINGNIDTIGHEFTHGITNCKLDWLYDQHGQSGALSEAYSDIFGEILEAEINIRKSNESKKKEPDWIHGERNSMNPHNYENSLYPYPATIEELNSARTSGDKKGNTVFLTISDHEGTDYAHFASTIIFHCAYLMWNGIGGNEQGKIDINTLANIWYRSLHLLQPNPTFSQCRNAVELSARSLWKSGKLTEKQYDTVIQAFNEVGIDRVSNYANKTLKNDFNMLVLNSEGKERVSAEIKIYPSATSSDIFFANKDTTVFEATFDSTSPEEGIHINLKDGRYLVEISDTATKKFAEPIGMIIEVDGNSKVATDNLTVYTDFKEITTVILNKDEEESRKDSNTAILSPESAIDIYMANKNIWMFNDEYIPMQRYGYCLLDLDFDGILELIKSANDGSGRYSNNNYYKINLENNSVEEVPSLAEGYGGGYDYYYLGTENIKLLSNKSNDSKFYYCTDYERIMTGDYVTRYGKMYLKDGKIQSDDLFANHQCEAGLQGNSEKINEYFYYEIGDGACPDVSEAEYNQFIADFFAENTDLHLAWNCIDGVEFDNADDGTKKQILLDAYRSFSYDGFSFDDLAINHTIKLEDHSKITVTGTMIEESYEIHSENKGTVYILILDKPIEAKLYNEFMGYNGEVKTISSVQVNISKSEYERYKGKEVTLSGNVMIAHTVHHRRDIVLDDCVFE